MRHFYIALAAIVLGTFAASRAAAERFDVRVLYCGDPGSEREADFRSFLEQHFAKVTTADLREFKEEQAKNHDVVIFDWSPIYDRKGEPDLEKFKQMRAQTPALSEQFSRPTILIGAMGGFVSMKAKLKTDWLCLCLSDSAHHLRSDHPVFRSPLEVNPEWTEMAIPKYYASETLDKSLGPTIKVWRVQTKDYPGIDPGLVSPLYGFTDSPDAEVVAQSIAGKGPDTVALGRHGNFFLWGFSAPPTVMTSSGQRLFVNAIVYMRQFDGQVPLARAKEASREWALRHAALAQEYSDERVDDSGKKLREVLQKQVAENPTMVPKEYEGDSAQFIAAQVEQSRKAMVEARESVLPESLRNQFGSDAEKYLAYYRENFEYLRPEADGAIRFLADEDAKALGLSNRRTELLDRCIAMLEQNDRPELAQRLLKRYTQEEFAAPAEWREWLTKNRDRLFFSDVGGYKFFVAPTAVSSKSIAVARTQADVRAVPAQRQIAAGPFEANWESLAKNYHCPEWFRDAKFGIWAHWTAQCVPEQGDWYARKMYIQGDGHNKYHVEHYGHPSEFGFKDIDNLWRAENWDPERLMQLYRAAGAKFFVALANHHDNFDCYDSKYHEWNSIRVGPHKDIVGTWAKVARDNGLRFGVSNHSAHAWHWFQPAYGYDPEGPQAGVRYDALLTKADGQGKWWEGLDPQELYTGPNMVLPDGLKTIKEAQVWHEQHDRKWTESPPADNPRFVDNWFLRCQDLVDKYNPDLIYLDNTQLPLGQAGLDIAAHYYNASMAKNGKLEAVLTAKKLKPDQRPALVEDYERGAAGDIQPLPWQTCSCIGNWHYKRGIKYRTAGQVVRMLVDIVSKNGCLLLSIPLRGDGTIDDEELAFLQGMARWMAVNGEGIFGTRPWKVFGEGPNRTAGGMFNEGKINYGPQDIRFTTKDGALYVYVLGEPTEDVSIKSLGLGSEFANPISEIKLLGSAEPVRWNQNQESLVITRPEKLPSAEAIAFKVTFR